MEGYAKFQIRYSWERKELVEKAKQQLKKEGWKICNETKPAYPEKVLQGEVFTCWFERKFKF